jgi:hypothetical protein
MAFLANMTGHSNRAWDRPFHLEPGRPILGSRLAAAGVRGCENVTQGSLIERSCSVSQSIGLSALQGVIKS